jgi:predicted membrane-bound spermidine synthase
VDLVILPPDTFQLGLSPMKNKVVAGLFLFSGVAGLFYESILANYLKIIFGHAIYGQILTLACFMGGMGLGSLVTSKYWAKIKNPLKIYFIVELSIAILALAFHPVFVWIRVILLEVIYPAWPSWSIFWINAIVGILITLPIAFLLGTTFPLVVNGVLNGGGNSKKIISGLYFSNSFGGAIGVLICSFIVIPKSGLPGALAFAACINLTLALAFLVISRGFATRELVQIQATESSLKMLNWTILVSFATGASSFLYEIAWIRLSALIFGSSNHTFDVMLAGFIFGLAGGSLWLSWYLKREKVTNEGALFYSQLFMGLSAVISIAGYSIWFEALNTLNLAIARNHLGYLLLQISKAGIICALIFPTAFFAGTTLPLLTAALLKSKKNGSAVGAIYGSNTLGAIVGATVGGIVLMPVVGLKGVFIVGALIDILLSLYIAKINILPRKSTYLALGGIVICLSYVSLVKLNQKVLVQGTFRGNPIQYESVTSLDGATATIAVGRIGKDLMLSTNGKIDASLSLDSASQPPDNGTQSSLAWLPMATRSSQYSAAIIGMGSGATAHYLLGDDRLKQLDVVEIEPAVVKLSQQFRPMNERIFTDERIHTHIQDARIYFSTTRAKYDMIISEPSNPWVSGVSGLFSTEFYHEISKSLKAGGVLCQWLHLYEFNNELFASTMGAILSEFKFVTIYQTISNGDIVILASTEELSPQVSNLVGSKVTHDLKLMKVDPKILLTGKVATQQSIKSMLTLAPMNSEYYPYIEPNAQEPFFLKSVVTYFSYLPHTETSPIQLFENPEISSALATKGGEAMLQSGISDNAIFLAGIDKLGLTISSGWLNNLEQRIPLDLWPKWIRLDPNAQKICNIVRESSSLPTKISSLFLMRYYASEGNLDSSLIFAKQLSTLNNLPPSQILEVASILLRRNENIAAKNFIERSNFALFDKYQKMLLEYIFSAQSV